MELVSAIQNEPHFYMVTTKGNLYFLSLHIPHCKIDRWEKQFLGTYETVDEKGQVVTVNRLPSTLCCN